MKRENICRIKFVLFTVVTFALMSFGTFSVQAQQAGDIVEITWGGENTKARIDSCRSDSCYLYLYDSSSGKWSEGTAFFRKDQIRGINIGTRNRQDDTDKSRQKGVSTNNTQQPADNAQPKAQPQPSAANGQLKYKVGQRVEYVDNGKWYKAIITGVRDDSADHYDHKIFSPYRVHPIGYNGYEDKWVCCADFTDVRSQLRPAGSGSTEPITGGEANDDVLKRMRGAIAAAPAQPGSGGGVPAKQYHCVYFVGNQLVDAAPFTITGNSSYTDSEGKRGTFNLASSTLTFHGGNYDGQRAEYETSGGQPRLHILGKSGRRVIDCD